MEHVPARSVVRSHREQPWLLPARIFWVAASLVALALFIAGLPVRAREIDGLYRGDIQATLTQNQTGQVVLSTWMGSAAAQAGVLQGDILLAVDGVEVTSLERAEALLGGEIGMPVTVRVQTGNFPARSLTVTRQSNIGSILRAY